MKLILAMTLLLAGVSASAQSKKEMQVAKAVTELKDAMVNPDSAKLASLVSDDLIYGHSGGSVESKQAFIQTLLSGRSDFVSIELTDQAIRVYQNTAVVRHVLDAKTNDGGKPGEVKLAILSVWNKQSHGWVMVARQAVKLAH